MFNKILKYFKGQKRAEQKKMDKEFSDRVDRLRLVMYKFIDIVFNNNYPLGYETWEKGQDGIKPIVGNLLNMYLEENIRLDDILFIKQVVLKTLEDIHESTVSSINHNLAYIDKKIWGVHKSDIDFEKLDEMIKMAQAEE